MYPLVYPAEGFGKKPDRLGEQMLNSANTVEEFNEKMKKSDCSPGNNLDLMREQEFGRAKEQIASGEGLGLGLALQQELDIEVKKDQKRSISINQ